jgi:Putative prokaryotic signal transducing protein
MADERVAVTTVSDEVEADVVCGLLRSAGIECGHRVTDEMDSPLHGIASDGPRDILVHESDLETARALLADAKQ